MTSKSKGPTPTPVDFPPVPHPITADRVVELMVLPRRDPRKPAEQHVKFRPMLANPYSNIREVQYRPDADDVFVMERGTTLFNLYLDEYSSYHFHHKGIMLSSAIPKRYRGYYFGWKKPFSSTHVAFLARHIPGTKAFRHPCLLFIEDRNHPRVSSGPIDPDILNPGDHPPKLTSKLSKASRRTTAAPHIFWVASRSQ